MFSENIKEKLKKTNLERYGVENIYQSEKIKEKIKNTNLIRYGYTNPFLNPDTLLNIHNKLKKTNLERNGYEYPFQDKILLKTILDKQSKTFVNKLYHNNILYQGSYELDFLFLCEKNNIKIEKPITIYYEFDNNKNKKYFPDFYYKPLNLIIEIKSTYHFNRLLDINIAKQKACIAQGYNFIFIIDKKYDDFLKLLDINVIS